MATYAENIWKNNIMVCGIVILFYKFCNLCIDLWLAMWDLVSSLVIYVVWNLNFMCTCKTVL